MTWIPNTLTFIRVLMLLPIMILLSSVQDATTYQWCFALFLVAALTDLIDGWAARHLHCESSLGAFLDPLADKILTNVLLVFLASRLPDWISLWLVLLLLGREFAVQGFRSMALCVGVLIRTELVSKLKTFFQLVAAGAVLVGLGWDELTDLARSVALLSLVLALIAGYASMAMIFIRNLDLWSRHPLKMEVR